MTSFDQARADSFGEKMGQVLNHAATALMVALIFLGGDLGPIVVLAVPPLAMSS